MNVKLALYGSHGGKLDEVEVTVNTDDDDGITFTKLAHSVDWCLAEGDVIRILQTDQE